MAQKGAYYDKYDPVSGGFRAPLAADLPATAIIAGANTTGDPLAVGLDTNGRVVPGAGTTGIVGVLVTTKNMKANDIVDVMTAGEIVCNNPASVIDSDGDIVTGLTTTGVLGVVAADATHVAVGFTTGDKRVIVRAAMRSFIGT